MRHALVVILLSFIPLNALAVPLNELIDTASGITQGDKVFDNFSASITVFGRGQPESLSGIDVSGITVGGAHGLRFASFFAAAGSVEIGEGGGVSLFVDFDVTATDPHKRIHAISLVLPDAELGGTASVFAFAGPASVNAFHDEFGGGTSVGPLDDVHTFSTSTPTIHVDAGVGASATSIGAASTSGFDVTFPQSVPEPSILLFLAAGAALVAAIARRRSQREGRRRSDH